MAGPRLGCDVTEHLHWPRVDCDRYREGDEWREYERRTADLDGLEPQERERRRREIAEELGM